MSKMNTLECIPGKEFLQCEENSAMYHYSEIIDEVESVSPGFMQQVNPEDIFIHAMEVKVTTYCSLHCRDCTHLIPYVNTQKFASVEKMLADLDKMLTVSKIGGLILLGGEVFMHPGFTVFIRGYQRLKNKGNVGFLRVTTNGTIIPSDEFCEAFCQIENGYVLFSNYGELSVRHEEAVAKLQSYGIRVVVWPLIKEWKSLGGYEKRDYSEEEVKKLYHVCHGKIYLHLHHGHLYHCYRVPCLNEEIFEKPVVTDYLDVRGSDIGELPEKLRSYINDTQYMQGCYYCGGFHTCSPSVPPAIQLKWQAK